MLLTYLGVLILLKFKPLMKPNAAHFSLWGTLSKMLIDFFRPVVLFTKNISRYDFLILVC